MEEEEKGNKLGFRKEDKDLILNSTPRRSLSYSVHHNTKIHNKAINLQCQKVF